MDSAQLTPNHAHPRPARSSRVLQGRMATPARARRVQVALDTLIVVLLFATSFLINDAYVDSTYLHPDETRWVNRAYYLDDVTDPYGATWQDYYISRGQPPGGSYLMGLGLLIQGQPLDANGVWDFHYSTEWNRTAGAVPSDEILHDARRTNAVVGALVVVLVYLVARMFTNRIGGILGGLFLAFHPLHITLSTQALSDELLALTLGLTFVAAYKFARRPGYGWALVMGLSLGLGGATKLAPLALSFVLAAYGVLWLAWRYRKQGKAALRWSASRSAAMLILQPVIAGFTFVALYPYLWVDPIGRSLDLLDFRRAEMASQARIWPWAQVNNPKDAFMRYGEQLSDAASTTRHLQEWMNDHLGTSIANPASFDFVLVGIGAILLLRIVIQKGLWSPESLVAMLMAAEVGAVTVGLGVDFYRYYLPVLLVNSILVGVAFGEGTRAAARLLARRREPDVRPTGQLATTTWDSGTLPPERAS